MPEPATAFDPEEWARIQVWDQIPPGTVHLVGVTETAAGERILVTVTATGLDPSAPTDTLRSESR